MIISSAEPLVPIFVFMLHQLKATVTRKYFTCSTGFKSYTAKVFASKTLFIVREINLETSG